jgi:hypothetical protein
MKLTLLRHLLMLDAAVLFLLGALLIFVPNHVELAFGFKDLPIAVNYLIGLWGCVFATLGFGYVIAATHPLRHLVWVHLPRARNCFLAAGCLRHSRRRFHGHRLPRLISKMRTDAQGRKPVM